MAQNLLGMRHVRLIFFDPSTHLRKINHITVILTIRYAIRTTSIIDTDYSLYCLTLRLSADVVRC